MLLNKAFIANHKASVKINNYSNTQNMNFRYYALSITINNATFCFLFQIKVVPSAENNFHVTSFTKTTLQGKLNRTFTHFTDSKQMVNTPPCKSRKGHWCVIFICFHKFRNSRRCKIFKSHQDLVRTLEIETVQKNSHN